MVSTAANIWRNKTVAGVNSSADWEPDKADIRAWGAWVEAGITAGTLNGPWMATKSALDADLAHAANTVGFVYATSDVGTYVKSGASGAGSWTKILDYVPGLQFARASDNGSTANAWVLTTSPQASASDGVTIVFGFVPATNTSDTVTATLDGGSSLAVKTGANNNPAIGTLVLGTPFTALISGSGTTLRMTSDTNAAANVAACEAALLEMRGLFVGAFADDTACDTYITANSITKIAGTKYYNTTSSVERYWDGSAWQTSPYATSADGSTTNAKLADSLALTLPFGVADRTAMAALSTSRYSLALLEENGREGLFQKALTSSLSAADQAAAAADTAEGRFVTSGSYTWVRKLPKPVNAMHYGMHPEETAANNVTALAAAIAAEAYVTIPAGTYSLNAGVTSPREGQILEGEGFNTVLQASAAIAGPMIETTTSRYQTIRDLYIDGNSNADTGVKLNYPKCHLIGARVSNTKERGVWMGYFSQFVGDGCVIIDNEKIGIQVSDATGQVNDMHIGGGRHSVCSANGQHGIMVATANRDGIWIEKWNMEQNASLGGAYCDVALNGADDGVFIREMYHETSYDNASFLFYRTVSSLMGVHWRDIKMNASSPTTPPNYLMSFSYTGGNLCGDYTLDGIWGAGYNTAFIFNNATAGGTNEIRYGTISNPDGGTLFSSSNAVSRW